MVIRKKNMMKEKYAKKSNQTKFENFTSVCSSKDINNLFINTLMEDEPFRLGQVSHHKLYQD